MAEKKRDGDAAAKLWDERKSDLRNIEQPAGALDARVTREQVAPPPDGRSARYTGRTRQVSVRILPSSAEKLEQLAKQHKTNITGMIEWLIDQAFLNDRT